MRLETYQRKHKGVCDFCNKEGELNLHCPVCGLLEKELDNIAAYDGICDNCEGAYLKARNEINYCPPYRKNKSRRIS